jgi:Tfp pilus assembly protein FimT
MSAVLIVVLAILAVLLLLAIVGAASASKRNRAQSEHFDKRLSEVDRQLAAAVAQDHGWERATLDAAARSAFATERPGEAIATLELVSIVDEPGTDEDLAVYRVVANGAASRLTLGRREGAWYAAAVEEDR